MSFQRWFASKAGAAALAILAAGCGDELLAPSYVGQVKGSDAVIGAVSDGARVVLYVCGGEETHATLTHWFQGPLDAGGGFSVESGGFTAEGDLARGTGTLRTDAGETLAFTVRPASGEREGLYAAMDGSCRTGAVVADLDGDGADALQGVWCDGKDRFAQVTPIMPLIVTARGIEVRAEIDPPKSLFVDRVRWP